MRSRSSFLWSDRSTPYSPSSRRRSCFSAGSRRRFGQTERELRGGEQGAGRRLAGCGSAGLSAAQPCRLLPGGRSTKLRAPGTEEGSAQVVLACGGGKVNLRQHLVQAGNQRLVTRGPCCRRLSVGLYFGLSFDRLLLLVHCCCPLHCDCIRLGFSLDVCTLLLHAGRLRWLSLDSGGGGGAAAAAAWRRGGWLRSCTCCGRCRRCLDIARCLWCCGSGRWLLRSLLTALCPSRGGLVSWWRGRGCVDC